MYTIHTPAQAAPLPAASQSKKPASEATTGLAVMFYQQHHPSTLRPVLSSTCSSVSIPRPFLFSVQRV